MATPILPFLYQTRTILRLSRAAQRQRVTVVRRLLYPTPVAWRRSGGVEGIQDDPIPFELPPDLASDPVFNPIKVKEKDGPTTTGTITPSERRAFDSIFKEIAQSSQAEGLSSDLFRSENPGRDRTVINTIIGDVTNATPNLMDRMRQLHNLDPQNRATARLSPEQRYEALLRFPPSLRRAARKALGAIDPDERPEDSEAAPLDLADEDAPLVEDVTEGKVDSKASAWPRIAPSHIRPSGQVELEKLRYNERTRVEQKMEAAETDFELWEVLEQEVFPMVARLGFGDMPGSKRKKNKKLMDKRSEDNGDHADGQGHDGVAASPSPQLDFAVHGPLYASHLRYALDTLSTKFPQSRLALSILPRVKSLGLVSYVLGASTNFYSALMHIYWTRYNDAEEVLRLLEEMRHAGLELDRAPRSLLKSMTSSIQSCATGEKGEFVLGIASMPEWTHLLGTRLDHWSVAVKVAIEEQHGDWRQRSAEAANRATRRAADRPFVSVNGMAG